MRCRSLGVARNVCETGIGKLSVYRILDERGDRSELANGQTEEAE
ncbi:hypothetical protein [Ferruginivarius sediminum]|nr:hypothetical protein [Ferruginivarius sediminum]